MEPTSKLRIKIGEVEMDYEGSEAFLKEELPELLKTAMELHKAAASDIPARPKSDTSGAGIRGVTSLTTASIAAKLKAKSGPDLVLAAAGRLVLIESKTTFSRQDLLTEMQSATGYYKKSYSNNLSKYLTAALSDGTLTENATNVFSLQAEAQENLEKQLANA
jgi:hypothetical protein